MQSDATNYQELFNECQEFRQNYITKIYEFLNIKQTYNISLFELKKVFDFLCGILGLNVYDMAIRLNDASIYHSYHLLHTDPSKIDTRRFHEKIMNFIYGGIADLSIYMNKNYLIEVPLESPYDKLFFSSQSNNVKNHNKMYVQYYNLINELKNIRNGRIFLINLATMPVSFLFVLCNSIVGARKNYCQILFFSNLKTYLEKIGYIEKSFGNTISFKYLLCFSEDNWSEVYSIIDIFKKKNVEIIYCDQFNDQKSPAYLFTLGIYLRNIFYDRDVLYCNFPENIQIAHMCAHLTIYNVKYKFATAVMKLPDKLKTTFFQLTDFLRSKVYIGNRQCILQKYLKDPDIETLNSEQIYRYIMKLNIDQLRKIISVEYSSDQLTKYFIDMKLDVTAFTNYLYRGYRYSAACEASKFLIISNIINE